MKTFLNILPPERKENLRLSKLYRDLIRQEVGLLFLVIFLGSLLSGVWFLLSLEERSVLNRVSEREQQDKSYADILFYEKEFSQVQAKIPMAEKLLKQQKNLIWVYHAIESNSPGGVMFSSISIEEGKLKIVGHSDNRENLLVFQESLQKIECFTDVKLPLSQIAQKESIDFEMEISIQPKCF